MPAERYKISLVYSPEVHVLCMSAMCPMNLLFFPLKNDINLEKCHFNFFDVFFYIDFRPTIHRKRWLPIWVKYSRMVWKVTDNLNSKSLVFSTLVLWLEYIPDNYNVLSCINYPKYNVMHIIILLFNFLYDLITFKYKSIMVAYFCHHLSDNYVDL